MSTLSQLNQNEAEIKRVSLIFVVWWRIRKRKQANNNQVVMTTTIPMNRLHGAKILEAKMQNHKGKEIMIAMIVIINESTDKQ